MKISFQTEKQKDPTKNDGFHVVYAPAKRFAFKVRWYLLVALILSPLVVFGWYIIKQQILITADGILTTDPIIIVATEEGFIRSINVTPGTIVQSQTQLIKMHSPILIKEQDLLTRNLKKFSNYHTKGFELLASLYQRQILNYKNADISQNLIHDDYDDYDERGMLPLSDKLLIQKNKISTKADHQQARIRYETALIEHNTGSLVKTILDIEVAITKVEAKQAMLSILSPKKAKVNSILVKEGQFVNKSDPLVSISNLAKPVVHVYLKPDRMDYVEIGQTATVTLPNGRTYDGIVNTPTQLSEKLPDVLSGPFRDHDAMIKVTLAISPIPDVMLEGLPVKVRFHYVVETALF